ncbi:hypothetical protein GCM10027075_25870 [Streptomyces heilongjiangensis]
MRETAPRSATDLLKTDARAEARPGTGVDRKPPVTGAQASVPGSQVPAADGARPARNRLRRAAHHLLTATPPTRDRAVDALRALAILGIVLGHWLVTALVPAGDGTFRTTSPLQYMPWLAPISWAFQTLAVFFLVGGHVATRSYSSARARGTTYPQWLRARLNRLFTPVAAVLVLWAAVTLGLLATGADLDTIHTLLALDLSPLWLRPGPTHGLLRRPRSWCRAGARDP